MPDPAVTVTQARVGQRTRGREVLRMMDRVARVSRVLVGRNTLALVARLMQGRVGHAILDPVVQAACAQPTASSDLFQSKQ